MASRLFRRLGRDLPTINGQQSRCGHWMRGKPPTIARNLEQRMEELNQKDPEISYRVNIGYKQKPVPREKIMSSWIANMKEARNDPEMEKKARNKQLIIDLEKSKEDWWQLSGPEQIRIIAEHYGVFEHLFGDAYFTPVLPIDVQYNLTTDTAASVHRGNILTPSDASKEPSVHYQAPDDSLWTLLLTTPDGSFINDENEVCHWFIGNIPGNNVAKGDLLVDYMRPIPARGIGYCRYIFVLYKQNERIDYSKYKKELPCLQLKERDWSTYNFYREHQEVITPATLAFFQADWDSSLSEFYRNTLEMKEPTYEYDFPKPYIRKQEWFPKGKPFNLYLDKYRDPKEINKEFLMKKLKNVHPFRPAPPPLKYPNAVGYSTELPSWLKLEVKKERLGWGRVNEIK